MGIRKARLLKKQASELLDALSEDRLKVALDFLGYLRDREEWEATWEIMANPEMVSDIKEAREDLRSGREDRLVPFDQVMQRVRDRLPQKG